MYKVLIGVCTGGTMRSETVNSLLHALEVLRQKDVEASVSIMIGGYVARNRNELVKTAQENGNTHLMFIDNDMVFPPNGILRLLDHDKDIVAGPYNARGVTGKPSVSTVKIGDDLTSHTEMEFNMGPKLFKCSGVGTGFMLIKTSVFDKLEKPYFIAWEEEDG